MIFYFLLKGNRQESFEHSRAAGPFIHSPQIKILPVSEAHAFGCPSTAFVSLDLSPRGWVFA